MLTSVIIAKSSPPTSPNGSRPTSPNPMLENRHTAQAKRRKFMRRILMFRQMDFEFAMWQMIYLLVSPQKVYRNFQYSKQTKDQWARDDPAFLVLLSICLCGPPTKTRNLLHPLKEAGNFVSVFTACFFVAFTASSVGFAIVLQLGVLHFFKFLLWVVFVDCIGVGLLIATVLWFVANRYLRVSGGNKPDVEWGFAFDVHLNAFFPLLIILHVVQLLLYIPLLDRSSFLSTLLGNTLWLIAITYYIYVTFLGYSALPFLRRTVAFLYPPCLVLICIFVISLLTNWNIARSVMYFYEYRVY